MPLQIRIPRELNLPLVLAATAAMSAPTTAEPVSLQGRLASGISGTQPFVLRIWDDEATTLLVQESSGNVVLDNGLFTLTAEFEPDAFANGPKWWTVTIAGVEYGTMPVTEAPMALHSRRLADSSDPTFETENIIGSAVAAGGYWANGLLSFANYAYYARPDTTQSGPTRPWINPDGDHRVVKLIGSGQNAGFGVIYEPGRVTSPLIWIDAIGAASPRNAFEVRALHNTAGRSDLLNDAYSAPLMRLRPNGFHSIWGSLELENDGEFPALATTQNVTVGSLTITGGADLAEPFLASPDQPAELRPGLVLSIDPDHPGALRIADAAYDTKVAGVYSGGNGLSIGMLMADTDSDLTGGGEGTLPLAMTGRVWVYADQTNGPIQPGDRLTTSGLMPGHAMRVSNSNRADGAVIGKAMTPMDTETGMVLVLVNLQ